jgi:hypothetical protein
MEAANPREEGTVMRRLVSLGAVIVVLLALTGSPHVDAQDATPEVVEPIITGDFTFREFADFGVVDAATLPAAPVAMNLFRIEFAPGSSVVFPPGDPGLGLHLVESGTLTLREFNTDIVVTRAANQATPDAETSETLPAGEETQLEPGDGFLWPPLAAGEFRNDGSDPVVLMIVNIAPPSGPQPEPDAGATTPTP